LEEAFVSRIFLGVGFGIGFGVAFGFGAAVAVGFGLGVAVAVGLGVGGGNSISLFAVVTIGFSSSVLSSFCGFGETSGVTRSAGGDASVSGSPAAPNQTMLSGFDARAAPDSSE